MTDNPYRPGAAQVPPYLAGRNAEKQEFARLLIQAPILENLVLTGIQGSGKTVLMREALHKNAVESGWIWVGSDISEAVPASESHFAQRLFANLSIFSGDWEYTASERQPIGFTSFPECQTAPFDYRTMLALFEHEPGLASDKIKRVLLEAWKLMQTNVPAKKGIIFAWDEAQNLADQSINRQYPIGVLLDVFSSLQSQGAPFMLLLAGLPTLPSKLVDSRAYAERMFRVVTLHNLNPEESRVAIAEPLAGEPEKIKACFNRCNDMIYKSTRGYPYFIQFWCRELYDYITGTQPISNGQDTGIVKRIIHKLDMDFFEIRWARLTDRQRDLLTVIACLENSDQEFSVQEIVAQSKSSVLEKSIDQAFSSSHVNQMLTALFNKGMVFKNRHGKYVLAVPILDQYIQRRMGIITMEMTKAAYQASKEVYHGRMSKEKAVYDLSAEHGLNRGSASDFIERFKKMMEGEKYTRASSKASTDYFLTRMFNDYGADGLKNAIKAAKAHVDYEEGVTGVTFHSIRAVIAKHEAILRSLRSN